VRKGVRGCECRIIDSLASVGRSLYSLCVMCSLEGERDSKPDDYRVSQKSLSGFQMSIFYFIFNFFSNVGIGLGILSWKHTRFSSGQKLSSFPNRLISRHVGDINWPTRSPDLTVTDLASCYCLKE
jgi:hypothetical protein